MEFNEKMRDFGMWAFDIITIEDFVSNGKLTADGKHFLDDVRDIVRMLDEETEAASYVKNG